MMQTPLSVSELNHQIKSLLESTFLSVYVAGEVSRVTYHSSGHLYFTLKDKNSSISCIMFRGNNQKLKFRVEEGMSVIIQGAISVYTPRGSYQINCISMEPSGSGALALAYEQLKKKLEAKGYFQNKKPLPKYPKTIALVTSRSGAALQDMLRVAKKRWSLIKIILIDTIVQGEEAKYSISNSIKIADKLGVDVIVISRGGGSLEDLWGFNEEIVAEAIYQAKTPIVSAVGHEIDFLISDFVADLRAPTPSAAMEMILPDISEVLISIDELIKHYNLIFKRVLLKKSEELRSIYYAYKQNSFLQKIELYKKEIDSLLLRYKEVFDHNIQNKSLTISSLITLLTQKGAQIISSKEQKLISLIETYRSNDPSKRVKDSFAQITKDNKPISLDRLSEGDIVSLVNPLVKVDAKVLNLKKLT